MVPKVAAILLATHAIGNSIHLYYIFYPLLKHDSIAMAYMDPSDIIAAAIPLSHLSRFVAQSCILTIIFMWGCQRAIQIQTGDEIHEQPCKYSSIVPNCILIGSMTIFLHCSFILCGINPWQLSLHTFASALYVALNAVLPITLLATTWGGGISNNALLQDHSSSKRFHFEELAEYLFGPISSNLKQSNENKLQRQQQQSNVTRQQVQRMHQISALGTFIGMCVCAIFRVLDHGMQIQRYPMPIIVGATVGRVCGAMLAIVVAAIS